VSTLSAAQIAAHAYSAGFRGMALTTAVAVALAESGGNPKIKGDTTITDAKWGPSIGLWQIRSLRADYGTGRERDANANLDPAINAKHAWSISHHGTTWQPWSTYTNGSYRAHLNEARTAAANAGKRQPENRPRSQNSKRPAGDRVVLDLGELRSLERFFEHGIDQLRQVRRAIADLEQDLRPARTALTETILAGLITQTFEYLQSPSTLLRAEERMDWHARYAERVRKLAERADGDDEKWSRSDALRFATSMGRADRAERAVLEALVIGTVVRRRGDLKQHLTHADHGTDHGKPNPVNTANLRNGYISPTRLSSVGDGENLLGPAARQFKRMDAAARTAGLDLHVNSGYRGYAEQAQLYADYRNGIGNLAAQPGHSTHGLGLSADIDVRNLKTLAWLRGNAANYGFVNDVPSEPWHWTYIHR
jgi:lysozyme-like protein/D-alanyl-D-alanine carboxypeptidase-like protein